MYHCHVFQQLWAKLLRVGGPPAVATLFSRLGAGRFLHNAFTHTSTAHFATSSVMICPRDSQNVSLISRRSSGGFHIHHPCLVHDDRVPCAVQEQCHGSTILRRRPFSAGTHHHLGSASSAVSDTLQLDAGPHIGLPVSTAASSLWTS